MEKLVFATNNKHKLYEARNILGREIDVLSLEDISFFGEIAETAETLEGNALIKAHYIKDKFGYDCFADDTGLLIEALGGRPGVYSARYAGEPSNSQKNMEKVLFEMKDKTIRKAAFVTCIAFINGQEEHLFHGEIRGEIITSGKGTAGFGYDPIFQPEGYDKTFAELGEDIKNKISHRAVALRHFAAFIKNSSSK